VKRGKEPEFSVEQSRCDRVLEENRIALVSAPWPLFDRPSIQLGALKAFVERGLPGMQVDTFHVYLKVARAVGYPVYHAVSESSWIAESAYAALLYPDRVKTLTRYWMRKCRRNPRLKSLDFEDFCRQIEAASVEFLETQDWSRYFLAGFSICLSQLTSSLYFIREMKRRFPRLPVVAGGSACAGALGESLVRSFSEIDYLISGEGEMPLLQLVEAVRGCDAALQKLDIPGLIQNGRPAGGNGPQQIPNLDDLPVPDYGDYFRDLASMGSGHVFMPRIPVEMSRGCWWNKRGNGCAFCNLNLQWRGYRAKTPERTVQEIETLVNRHQVLSLSFMDNLLPAGRLKDRFNEIEELGLDLRMFCELRAGTSRAELEAMGAAGMREVQVGIEGLSTGLLTKINKGTTAIENLKIMKNCESWRLPDLKGNLILGFPSSDAGDVEETLHNLDFAFPFRPLKGIELWLGYGSPLWHNPGRYGIRLKGNHPDYRYLFPVEEFKGLRLMMLGYQGGINEQRRMWKPVRKKLEEWAAFYGQMHMEPGFEPILSYRDGKRFMIIRERRLNEETMTHRLEGSSRGIYLFCETQRSIAEIVERFSNIGEDRIRPFLRMMVDKRLMFCERDRYLALAVPRDPFRRVRPV
jgi:ribosomal peptide maturation radical SAM protein 1